MKNYWSRYLDKEVKRGFDRGYILHRIKRYLTSGCALCWDNCRCGKNAKP